MSLMRRLAALLPVLALLFALAGIAGARAGAERLTQPEHFALCLGGEKTGGEQPAGGHECLDCCLPTLVGAPALLAVPMQGVRLLGALAPQAGAFELAGLGPLQPSSRGPPVLA